MLLPRGRLLQGHQRGRDAPNGVQGGSSNWVPPDYEASAGRVTRVTLGAGVCLVAPLVNCSREGFLFWGVLGPDLTQKSANSLQGIKTACIDTRTPASRNHGSPIPPFLSDACTLTMLWEGGFALSCCATVAPRTFAPWAQAPLRLLSPEPQAGRSDAVGRRVVRAAQGLTPPLGVLPAGRMERGSSAETRRGPRPPKQHSQSSSRTSALLEHPEASRGPHAILESKVKALKEKRGGGRPGTPAAAAERPSPKKPRPRRGKPGADAAAVEPRAQLRTYLTDGLLDGEPATDSTPAPRAGTPGLWLVPAPRDVPGGTELPQGESSGSRGSASLRERHPLGEEARTPLRDRGGPSVSPTTAKGWERLSLAERVERNRQLLQEVLGLDAPGLYSGQVAAVSVELGGVERKSFGVKQGPWCCPPASYGVGTPQCCPIPCRCCVPFTGSCGGCSQTTWGASSHGCSGCCWSPSTFW